MTKNTNELTRKNVEDTGEDFILSDNLKEKLYSKSPTLKFKNVLTLNSKRSDRKKSDGTTTTGYKTVGVTVITTEDLEYYYVPSQYDSKTGIPDGVVEKRTAKAGEEIDLTYTELMLILSQPEFGGYFTRDDDPMGVHLKLKFPKFSAGNYALPIPNLLFTKKGSPKDYFEFIDERDEDNEWVLKERYAEKFDGMIPKKKVLRKDNALDLNIEDIPTQTKAILGMNKLLNLDSLGE